MRPNVALSGLLACLGCSNGILAADTTEELAPRQDTGISQPPKSNSVVWVQQTEPSLQLEPVVHRNSNLTFWFIKANGAKITTVRLKKYDARSKESDDDETLDETILQAIAPPEERQAKPSLSLDGILARGPVGDSVTITWDKWANLQHSPLLDPSDTVNQYMNLPLYLECEWTKSTTSGSSYTQLFAFFFLSKEQAKKMVYTATKGSQEPKWPESPEDPSPSPSPTPAVPTPSPETSQPAATIGPQSPIPAPTGLSQNGIIGVAVGVTSRRRHDRDMALRNDLAQIITRRIRIARLRHRPDHRRASTITAAAAAAAAAGAVGAAGTAATKQTDSGWTRHSQTPEPAVASRYAHLVEEGMTEEEIRRLEEEERQLDAAIENAGRRGNS
ncbi:hypothetical protein NUW58_g4236 [Xylaria curta]|uniref:Uncharacterized protein n=1 Tax=Xylaria curta TaxID=42375 RepID=A0ACC1PAB7_9PEZI|nr:hypothetical protein NUW58_g4236 [Xylaria curta]